MHHIIDRAAPIYIVWDKDTRHRDPLGCISSVWPAYRKALAWPMDWADCMALHGQASLGHIISGDKWGMCYTAHRALHATPGYCTHGPHGS